MATQFKTLNPADYVAAPRADVVREGRKEEAQTGQIGSSAASLAASARRTTALTPLEAEEKRLAIAEKERKAEADRRKKAIAEKAGKTAQFRLREDTNETLNAIKQARSLATNWSTGWGSLLRGIPTTEALDLDAIIGAEGPLGARIMLSKMGELKAQSATGATGMGSQSNAEGAALRNSIASLKQAQSKDRVLQSLADIERHYRRYYAFTQGEDPDKKDVAVRYGLITPDAKPPEASVPPTDGELTGTMEERRPAELRGVNSAVKQLFKQGRSAEEIRAYLNQVQPGMGDNAKNIEWYVDYYRQNPKGGIEPKIDLERVMVPKEGVARAIGEVAESPVGAGLIGAGDVASFGLLDELTSNPELTRAVMAGVQEENPNAYLAGQIAGGLTTGSGIQKLATKYGMKLSPMLAASLEGGAYGLGSGGDTFGDRALSAVTGATTGAVGGKLASYVPRVFGGMTAGIDDLSKKYLSERGIPLTLGEMTGGRLKKVEEFLSKAPIAGSAIQARRGEAVDAFNRTAFDEALAPIGETTGGKIAHQGIQTAKRKITAAYNEALGGRQFQPDTPFMDNVQDTLVRIGEIPNVGANVLFAINKKVGEFLQPGRTFDGDEFQAALRGIKNVSKDFKKNELFGSSIGPELNNLLDTFTGLVERQAPEALPLYSAANKAWRHYSVLKDAVSTSGTKNAGRFTPDILNSAGSRNAAMFGGRGAAAEGNYPFFDLSQKALEVLTPPTREVTVGQFSVPVGLGLTTGAGAYLAQGQKNKEGEIEGRDPVMSAGAGLLTALAAASPYSRLTQKYLQQGLMGPRSPGVKAFGEFLKGPAANVSAIAAAPAAYRAYEGYSPEIPDVVASYAQGVPEGNPEMANGAAPAAPEAPQAAEGAAYGEMLDKSTGRYVAQNEDGTYFYTDTGEEAPNVAFARGGPVRSHFAYPVGG